jgi:hypothetical protein
MCFSVKGYLDRETPMPGLSKARDATKDAFPTATTSQQSVNE